MKHIKEQLNDFKQEYNAIPVPIEAKNRVLKGISRGKKEHFRRAMGRMSASAAAVAMLALVLLPNLHPSIAHAMEQLPVIGAISQVFTFRTYENQNGDLEADIAVPQIENAPSSVNGSIQEYADKLIAMYEKEVADSQGQEHYSLTTSYEVVTDTPHYLCLRLNTTMVMASGTEFTKIFTIDKTTGEQLSLSSLFKDHPETLNAVSENIKEQMRAQMNADPSVIYFLDDPDFPENNFTGLSGEESFYFDTNGLLVIVFDEYEVAPGYMGAVSFTIPENIARKFI